MWPHGTHPMLFTGSSCVCMPSFRPVAPFFFLAKVPFLAIFFNTERGVAMKRSPGDTNSIYMWVCGSKFNCSGVKDRPTIRTFIVYIKIILKYIKVELALQTSGMAYD